MRLHPPPLAWASLLALISVPAAVLLGLLSGSAGWGWPSDEILWLIRAPRVLAAFGTGAGLALAGTLIQLVTRNPLGDPHILGITGGASVGALVAIMLGTIGLSIAPELGAIAGALLAMTMVFSLAWRSMARGAAVQSQPGTVVVLLVGVMIGTACGAIVSFLLAIANDLQLRNLIFWLLGDLNGAALWWPVWLACAAAMLIAWPKAHELDWLARGDAWAWTLGVPVARRRRLAILAASIATGAAVATAGSIGFVGLLAPHVVRLTGLRSARQLLPFAALFGGVFLVLADTLARTVIAPAQLPVGVISAVVGVPLFLVLLLRRRNPS